MGHGIHPWVAENRGRARFGVCAVPLDGWSGVREIAEAAENLGFDSFWLADHPLAGYDSWTLLAGLAATTRRIRLGTMVTCVYYRHPVQLARAVADVDRISNGRAVLGIGSGDMPMEFEQMGLGFPPAGERAAALEEALTFIPQLLRGERVDFQGERFRVAGVQLRNHAVQEPYVPIVIAGGGPKTTLRLTGLHADASNLAAASWAGGAFTPDDVKAKFDILRSRCAEAGRPFEAVLRTTMLSFHLADTEEQAAAMREAAAQDPVRSRLVAFMQGITHFCTPAQAGDRIKALRRAGFEYFVVNAGSTAALERFAKEVMPAAAEGAPEKAPA